MTIASHNRTRLDRITDLAVRWRMVGFVLAVAVTLCAFPVAQGLTYNRSIESLYSPDDPDLQAFEDSKSLFGGDEFAVVAYVDPNLMADDGRSLHEDAEERLEAFADRLSRVPGVIPAATQHLAIALRRRFMRERVREMAEDFLVGRDNQTTAIVLRLASRNDTDVDLANVLSELNHTASAVSSANPGDQTHLTAIRRLCREYRDEFGKAQAITDVGELLAGFQSDDDPGEVVAAIRDLAGGGPPSLSESGTPGEICLLLSEQPDADPRTSIKDVRRLLNARRAAVVHAETLSEIRFLAKDESEASTGPSDIMLRVRRLLGRIGVYVERATTIREIRRLAAEHDPPAFVVGEPVQIHDMFQIVEEDADLLFGVSMALLSTVILVLFRQLRWVLLPVAVVIMTIKWTEAFFAVGGFRLSMVSSMLNSMVTIIGIATVTHITVHYRDARRESTATDALRQTLSDLLPAVFWTCATTAVGFAALLASDVQPVRSFGMMMSFASLLVVIVTMLVLPFGVLLGRRRSAPRTAPAEARLSRALQATTIGIERFPRLALLGFVAAFVMTLPGLFRLRIETDFSRNFRESTPIVRSLEFVESNLGGAGTWEVNFPAPSVLDEEFLDRVRAFSVRLRDISDETDAPRLKVVSLTDGLDMVPKPGLFLNTLVQRIRVLTKLQPEFVPGVYNPDAGRMRVILRAKERQRSETKLELINTVQQLALDAFGPDAVPADAAGSPEPSSARTPTTQRPPQTTGIFVLMALVIQSLLHDQLISFSWAAIGIAVMMSIAFRSLLTGLITLIPNVFPIVFIIGSMGWLNIPINIGTAMIASVSMGLTVDSSIHYISAYRRARRTMPVSEALRHTHQGVGRALVFAHMALIGGFSVLTISQFIPLVYFGILLSLAMLGGLAGGLVLLPLLLRMTDRDGDAGLEQAAS